MIQFKHQAQAGVPPTFEGIVSVQTERRNDLSTALAELLFTLISGAFFGATIYFIVYSKPAVAAVLAIGGVLAYIFMLKADRSYWHPLRDIQTTQ